MWTVPHVNNASILGCLDCSIAWALTGRTWHFTPPFEHLVLELPYGGHGCSPWSPYVDEWLERWCPVTWEHQIVQRVLPTQLLVNVDLSAMTYCYSAAVCFSAVSHGDSDDEPIDGASSGINGKCSCAKDGLGGSPMGLATAKPLVLPTLVRSAGHQVT
jgi:hypothetical protein